VLGLLACLARDSLTALAHLLLYRRVVYSNLVNYHKI